MGVALTACGPFPIEPDVVDVQSQEQPLNRKVNGQILRSVASYSKYSADRFKAFDVGAGVGGEDGKIGMSDLDAVRKDTSQPLQTRLAARIMLDHFSVFDAAGTGVQDGFIDHKDLSSVSLNWNLEREGPTTRAEKAFVAEAILNQGPWIDGYVAPIRNSDGPEVAQPQRPKDGLIDREDLTAMATHFSDSDRLAAAAALELFNTFDTAELGGQPDGKISVPDLEAIRRQAEPDLK
jgi:hypothetical protein